MNNIQTHFDSLESLKKYYSDRNFDISLIEIEPIDNYQQFIMIVGGTMQHIWENQRLLYKSITLSDEQINVNTEPDPPGSTLSITCLKIQKMGMNVFQPYLLDYETQQKIKNGVVKVEYYDQVYVNENSAISRFLLELKPEFVLNN